VNSGHTRASVALSSILLLLPLAAAAQAPTPIRFEKGKTSAVVQGTVEVSAGEAAMPAYTLRAAAGQTMTVRFTATEPVRPSPANGASAASLACHPE
jgi:hypothetical protein